MIALLSPDFLTLATMFLLSATEPEHIMTVALIALFCNIAYCISSCNEWESMTAIKLCAEGALLCGAGS